MSTKKKVLWVLGVLVLAYIVAVLARVYYLELADRTAVQVAKIHATKLAMDDVLGKSLPPDPGAAADKTVAGVDANKNGIRDDVELAIFKEYPNSAKTRAVLLQYALALQMEMTQPVVNTETVNAVLSEDSRAGDCIADTLVPRASPESARTEKQIAEIDQYLQFVSERQFNTSGRKQARENFYARMSSYGNSNNSLCDVAM